MSFVSVWILQENADDCGGASVISLPASLLFICLSIAGSISWWWTTLFFKVLLKKLSNFWNFIHYDNRIKPFNGLLLPWTLSDSCTTVNCLKRRRLQHAFLKGTVSHQVLQSYIQARAQQVWSEDLQCICKYAHLPSKSTFLLLFS